jgi:hypothetical protein
MARPSPRCLYNPPRRIDDASFGGRTKNVVDGVAHARGGFAMMVNKQQRQVMAGGKTMKAAQHHGHINCVHRIGASDAAAEGVNDDEAVAGAGGDQQVDQPLLRERLPLPCER